MRAHGLFLSPRPLYLSLFLHICLLCLTQTPSATAAPHPPTPTHPYVSVGLSLCSVFPCICICLSVGLPDPLAGAIQSALLIQGQQSVLSLSWCQTPERGVVWKLNLDSLPNHTAVMLRIWPPVNIWSLTLPITYPFLFWSRNKHFYFFF